MKNSTSFDTVCAYVTEDIRKALRSADNVSEITEIRLYNGRGIALVSREAVRFLSADGELCDQFGENCMKITSSALRTILTRLSRYSVYNHERELSEGCFVLENGVRAGISGVFSPNSVLKEIASVNFRIARQIIGCADEVFSSTYGRSILICGAVNSGKTTMLRDICRSYGNIHKCSLIDERNEVAAVRDGRPCNDVGLLTDIITGRPRHEGVIGAIRTLSPSYIFCDEIADSSDAAAVRECVGCGVKIIATIHAENITDLYSRSAAQELLSLGAFEKAVFISGGKLREIRSLGNGSKSSGSSSYNSMRRTVGHIPLGGV